jgi:cobalt-precorrin-5B (C1)-methyltransferase
MVLCGEDAPRQVSVTLGGGQVAAIPLVFARVVDGGQRAAASVRKDAGDDPDVTNGMEVVVTLWPVEGGETVFLAGEGVGSVTKPGLQIGPGQPAINPGPRRMISAAIAEVTPQAMCVEVAIPGGREVAARTYNPRLGIVGGLSVLGTTGIVRPYCKKAMLDSLKCSLDVAFACGVRSPVLAPGNIGAKAARTHFRLAEEQVIEVGNEWGFMAGALGGYAFGAIMVAGHPGKLAKLAAGDWDTHSSRSGSAARYVAELAQKVLGRTVPEAATTEGIFASLGVAERGRVAGELARLVRLALCERIGGERGGDASAGSMGGTPMVLTGKMPVLRACELTGETSVPRADGTPVPRAVAVILVDMSGLELGRDGDFSPWL